MRPLFYLVALATTALAVTACKRPEDPAASEAAAANATGQAPDAAPPAPASDASIMSDIPPTSAGDTGMPATAGAGATTTSEGGTTTPQGSPPPVNAPLP